jgi:hypothetical protein
MPRVLLLLLLLLLTRAVKKSMLEMPIAMSPTETLVHTNGSFASTGTGHISLDNSVITLSGVPSGATHTRRESRWRRFPSYTTVVATHAVPSVARIHNRFGRCAV